MKTTGMPKHRGRKYQSLRAYIEHFDGAATRSSPRIKIIASASGVSGEVIYRAALGDRLPSASSARKISDAIGGAVTPSVIMGVE